MRTKDEKEKWLKPGERIDDLQCRGYDIIQNKDVFCFGMDAVLLADFATGAPNGSVIDRWDRDRRDPDADAGARQGQTFYRT